MPVLKNSRQLWTREQLLVAFSLYCQIPFGKLHAKNPDIIKCAEGIGRTPSALAMKLCNIASLDQKVTATGRRGLSGASKADRELWNEIHDDWGKFAVELKSATDKLFQSKESQTDADDHAGEERTVQASVRIGQAFFRQTLLNAYESKCCVTGLSEPRLLVASHIIPWRCDKKNRMNPRNGLLLSALHDKAFDLGIITINENMTVRVSETLSSNDSYTEESIVSYNGKRIAIPNKFYPDPAFLAYHRLYIFDKK
ncbi:Putative restriction endonuclease [Candidatus Electronema halotolerans]